MGAFNAGEIFGALRLDDAEFRRQLQENSELAKSLKINIASIQGTVTGLQSAFKSAGVEIEGINKWMKSFQSQGYSANSAVQMLESSLGKLQTRAAALQMHQGTVRKGLPLTVADEINAAYSGRGREITAANEKIAQSAAAATQKSNAEQVASERAKEAQIEAMWNQREASDARHNTTISRNAEKRVNQEIALNRRAAEEARRADVRRADAVYQQEQREQRRLEHEAHRQYFEYRQQTAASFGMGALGMGMTVASAAPVAGLGLAAKVFADFDEQITKSTAIMGSLSQFQRKDMVDSARLLATETGKSVDELAGAYYYLKSAGLSVGESIAALPVVTRFSIAANSDLQKSTELLTSAMSAMGMEANDLTHISDVLVKADIIAKGKAIEFAEALAGKGGGALRLVHKDIEEGVAILAAFAKVGINAKTAQEALNQVLRDFQKVAIKDKVIEINGELFKFRDIVYDSRGGMRNFSDILGDFEKKLAGMSDEQVRSTFIALGFQDRSVKATQSVLGFSEAIRNYEKELRHSQGTTREVAENQLVTFNRNLGILKARMSDVAITIGEPVVKSLQSFIEFIDPAVRGVKRLSEEFDRLPDAVKKGTVGIVGTGGILGMMTGGALTSAASVIQTGAMAKFLMGPELFGEAIGKSPLLSKYLLGPEAATLTVSLLGSIGLAIGGMTSALTGATLGWVELQDSMKAAGIEITELGNRIEKLSSRLKPGDAAFANQAYELAKQRIGEIGITGREDTTGMGEAEYRAYQGKIKEMKEAQDVMFRFQADRDKYRRNTIGITDVGRIQDVNASLKESLRKNANAYGLPTTWDVDLDTGLDKDGVGKGSTIHYMKVEMDLFNDSSLKANKTLRELWITAKIAADESKDATDGYVKAREANLKQTAIGVLGNKVAGGEDISGMLGSKVGSQTVTSAILDEANALGVLTRAMMDGTLVAETYKELQKEVSENTTKVAKSLPGILGAAPATMTPAQLQNYMMGNQYAGSMKEMGMASQGDLNLKAQEWTKLYQQVAKEAGDSAWDTRIAWVAMVESIARAHHVLPDQVSKDYRRIKESVEDTVSASQRLWQKHLQSTSRAIGSLFGNLTTNAFDMLFGDSGSKTDKLAPLVTMFRSAMESLGTQGYTDQAKALRMVVDQIKNAGSEAEANAIAIKHFGDQGTMLARDLRGGSISAGDLSEAMAKASQSIQDFAAQTEDKVGRFEKLWKDAVKGIARALAEDLGRSLNEHINLVGNLEKGLGKIFGLGGKAAGAVGSSMDVVGLTGTAGQTGMDIYSGVYGGAKATTGAASGVGGAVSSTLGSLTSTFGAVGSIGSMISGVVGNFQMAGTNKTLDLIEHEVRYTHLIQQAMMDLHNSQLPKLESIWGYLWEVQPVYLNKITASLETMEAGRGGGIQIETVNLYEVNDPETLVRELKALKAV